MPGWYSGLCVPSLRDAHVAGRDAAHRARSSSYRTSAAAKPGIDLDAERLGLLRRASGTRCRGSRCSCRDCSSAAAAATSGMRYALCAREDRKRSSVTGVSSGAPCACQSGSSSFSALGIDDGAGQDVRADLRALFEHADGDLARVLGARAASGGSPPTGPAGRRRRSPRRIPSLRAACCPRTTFRRRLAGVRRVRDPAIIIAVSPTTLAMCRGATARPHHTGRRYAGATWTRWATSTTPSTSATWSRRASNG